MFQTVSLSIIRSFHCTHRNGICHKRLMTSCEQDRDGCSSVLIRPDPARKLSTNLYDIYHCCVHSEKLLMMDRGTIQSWYSFITK